MGQRQAFAVASSVLISAALLIGLPAARAGAVTATGTDPTGDTTPASNDITSLGVALDHSDVTITLHTAAALPVGSDSSWDKRMVVVALEGGLDPDINIESSDIKRLTDQAVAQRRAANSGQSADNSKKDSSDDSLKSDNFGSIVLSNLFGLAPFNSYAGSGSDHGDSDACDTTNYNLSGTTLTLHAPASCFGYLGAVKAVGAIVSFDNDLNPIVASTDIAISNNLASATSVNASVGGGYYALGSDGGVFSFGDAQFYGSTGNLKLNKPVVGMSNMPTNNGYRFVASDGGIFAYGNAPFYGSMGGKPLNKPIVGMTTTANGAGYYLVASDGGIFAYGNAAFYGSMGGKPLNSPIVGMTTTPSGNGYWLVAADGGIFAYGDAAFYGSMGGKTLNKPIVGMAASATGHGYVFVASDGGVFAFGDGKYEGSGVDDFFDDVVGIQSQGTDGYDLVGAEGDIYNYGPTGYDFGDPYRYNVDLNGSLVGMATLH